MGDVDTWMGVITAVTTALLGLVVWMIKDTRTAKRTAKETADGTTALLREGLQVILREQLVKAHATILKQGHVTASQRASFVETDSLYVRLGGNGPTSHLTEDLARFRIVADDDPHLAEWSDHDHR